MGLLVYMSMKCCQDFWDPWGRGEEGKVAWPPPKLPSSPGTNHPFSLTARISHSTLPCWCLMPFEDPFWGSSEPPGSLTEDLVNMDHGLGLRNPPPRHGPDEDTETGSTITEPFLRFHALATPAMLHYSP